MMSNDRKSSGVTRGMWLTALGGALAAIELDRVSKLGQSRLRRGTRFARMVRTVLVVLPVLWTLYAVLLGLSVWTAVNVSGVFGGICLIVLCGACFLHTIDYLSLAWNG